MIISCHTVPTPNLSAGDVAPYVPPPAGATLLAEDGSTLLNEDGSTLENEQ